MCILLLARIFTVNWTSPEAVASPRPFSFLDNNNLCNTDRCALRTRLTYQRLCNATFVKKSIIRSKIQHRFSADTDVDGYTRAIIIPIVSRQNPVYVG